MYVHYFPEENGLVTWFMFVLQKKQIYITSLRVEAVFSGEI